MAVEEVDGWWKGKARKERGTKERRDGSFAVNFVSFQLSILNSCEETEQGQVRLHVGAMVDTRFPPPPG